jgi:hypothetical protein
MAFPHFVFLMPAREGLAGQASAGSHKSATGHRWMGQELFAALISKRHTRSWKAVAAQHFSQNERLLAMT